MDSHTSLPEGSSPTTLMRTALGVLAGVATEVAPLGEIFEKAGHEIALVGGPVRDAFLGRRSADLDFATSARPRKPRTCWPSGVTRCGISVAHSARLARVAATSLLR